MVFGCLILRMTKGNNMTGGYTDLNKTGVYDTDEFKSLEMELEGIRKEWRKTATELGNTVNAKWEMEKRLKKDLAVSDGMIKALNNASLWQRIKWVFNPLMVDWVSVDEKDPI